jgi:hypothetical protein
MSVWIELLALGTISLTVGCLAHRVLDESLPSPEDHGRDLRRHARAVDQAVDQLAAELPRKGGPP